MHASRRWLASSVVDLLDTFLQLSCAMAQLQQYVVERCGMDGNGREFDSGTNYSRGWRDHICSLSQGQSMDGDEHACMASRFLYFGGRF